MKTRMIIMDGGAAAPKALVEDVERMLAKGYSVSTVNKKLRRLDNAATVLEVDGPLPLGLALGLGRVVFDADLDHATGW